MRGQRYSSIGIFGKTVGALAVPHPKPARTENHIFSFSITVSLVLTPLSNFTMTGNILTTIGLSCEDIGMTSELYMAEKSE